MISCIHWYRSIHTCKKAQNIFKSSVTTVQCNESFWIFHQHKFIYSYYFHTQMVLSPIRMGCLKSLKLSLPTLKCFCHPWTNIAYCVVDILLDQQLLVAYSLKVAFLSNVLGNTGSMVVLRSFCNLGLQLDLKLT